MRADSDRYEDEIDEYDVPDGYDALDEHDGLDEYDAPYGYDALDEDDGPYGYDVPDDFVGLHDSSAYWRRRFFILAAGIAALVLCVWLFPGGRPASRPAPARTSASARASIAALAGRSAPASAAYGTAWLGPTAKRPTTKRPTAKRPTTKRPARKSPRATPSPTTSANHPAAAKSRKSRKSAKRSKKPSAGHHPGHSATAAGEPRCRPADIVLSLVTSQASYAQDEWPSFSVYAVSTSATACTLSYGPGSVQVDVTRNGRVVWDSAACKPKAAPRVRFTLGVPQVLTMPWNRRAGGPSGCAGSLPAGAWGTFDAVAVTAGQSSPVRSFRLVKPKS